MNQLLSKAEFHSALLNSESARNNRIGVLEAKLPSHTLYMFGYGSKGQSMARHIANQGRKNLVIYDSSENAREKAREDGFLVVDDIELLHADNSLIILAACQAQLEQASLVGKSFIFYQEAGYIFDQPFHFDSSRAFTDAILPNWENFYNIYSLVSHNSRQSFLEILSFRLSLNPAVLRDSKRSCNAMWFDVLNEQERNSYKCFLDIGAFDGDTLLKALDHFSVDRAIAVEANSSFFPKIKDLDRLYKHGVQIYPFAAWSKTCSLTFEERPDGMMRVWEDINGAIKAVSLDSLINEEVSLIKMDIEGSEEQALQGIKSVVNKWKPDLAIACYHRPLDMLMLFNWMTGNNFLEYYSGIEIAHYSDCLDDTIAYFIRDVT